MEYSCGCKLKQLGHVITEIDYCPLHKAAPDLYEACKLVEKDAMPEKRISFNTLETVMKAIAKAEES